MEIVESLREVGNYPASDEFLRDLLGIFTDQSEKATREIGAALARGEISQVRYYAHQLKGSAANVGAAYLASRAEAMEKALRREGWDLEFITRTAEALPTLRDESLIALRSLLLLPVRAPESPLHPRTT
jgi:HPt (histidine-containing phosphotransfer) domain-containing protein